MGHLDLSKTEIGPFSWTYTERDTILYALGVGCHWNEQRYVFEGHSDFAPLPTMAVIPPYHDVLASVPLQDVLPKYNPVSQNNTLLHLVRRTNCTALPALAVARELTHRQP